MADVAKLMKVGKDLGLDGQELREFVKEQQEREAQLQREQAQLQREQQERELQLAKVRMAEASEARAAVREKLELELRLAEARRALPQVKSEAGSYRAAPVPKLPKFDEEKDDMDAFLERFERFAQCQEWPEGSWSINLSPLLTGKGLQVYSSMPAKEAMEYRSLKAALLKRYQLNEEGFRKKFRESKPDTGETAPQYVSKLQIYFSRWMELARVEETYDALKDMMIRDQFLSVCHEDLATFLKERMSELDSVEKMAQVAEKYLDAHCCTITGKSTKRGGQNSQKPGGFRPKFATSGANVQPTKEGREGISGNSGRQRQVECFLCHKIGHMARECKVGQQSQNKTQQKAAAVRVCSRHKRTTKHSRKLQL